MYLGLAAVSWEGWIGRCARLPSSAGQHHPHAPSGHSCPKAHRGKSLGFAASLHVDNPCVSGPAGSKAGIVLRSHQIVHAGWSFKRAGNIIEMATFLCVNRTRVSCRQPDNMKES